MDGRAHILRSSVGQQLIQSPYLVCIQAGNFTIVSYPQEQHATTTVCKRSQLCGKTVSIVRIAFELLVAIRATHQLLLEFGFIHGTLTYPQVCNVACFCAYPRIPISRG